MNDKRDAVRAEGGAGPPPVTPAPAPASAPLAVVPRRPVRLPAETGPLLGLLGVFLLFFVLLWWRGQLGSFLSLDNLELLLNRNAIPMVVVLGMLFIIVSGGIDLSVGSVVALSAVATVLTYQEVLDLTHWPAAAGVAAILAGIGVGGLCGLANGLAVSWLRLTPFVATLGMLSIARGLAYWLSGRTKITLGETPAWVDALQEAGSWQPLFDARCWTALFHGNLRYVAWCIWRLFDPGVWSACLLAVVSLLVLRFTVFGRYVYAIGSNEATARLCGVNVQWNKAAVYTLAGLLTGWAGVLAFAQGSGSGDPTVKVGLELEVIAAAVIGGASLRGGQGSVVGVLLGVLILGVLENGVNRCGVPLEVKYILIGVIVVGNTALSEWQRRRAR